VTDIAIGTGATGTRTEHDSIGPIDVPAEHYWGAQTQRSPVIGYDKAAAIAQDAHVHGSTLREAALASGAIDAAAFDAAVDPRLMV
jgi:fumarate hydratase class II